MNSPTALGVCLLGAGAAYAAYTMYTAPSPPPSRRHRDPDALDIDKFQSEVLKMALENAAEQVRMCYPSKGS